MDTRVYWSPDGEFFPNPTREFMRSALDAGPDIWDGGSGSATICWLDRREDGSYAVTPELNRRPALNLFRFERDLWHLAYDPPGGTTRLMVFDAAAPEGSIEHYLGGEPAAFPRQSLVGREQAEWAIGHFLDTEEPWPELTWRPQHDLGDGQFVYPPPP